MFNLLPHELIVDNFAGGGGTSTGLERTLGDRLILLLIMILKLAMHRVNHPLTKHYCESVWDVDPVEITGNQPVGLVCSSRTVNTIPKLREVNLSIKTFRDWPGLHCAGQQRFDLV